MDIRIRRANKDWKPLSTVFFGTYPQDYDILDVLKNCSIHKMVLKEPKARNELTYIAQFASSTFQENCFGDIEYHYNVIVFTNYRNMAHVFPYTICTMAPAQVLESLKLSHTKVL